MSSKNIESIMAIVMAEYFTAFGQGTGVRLVSRNALEYLHERVYGPTKNVIQADGLAAWLEDRTWVLELMRQVGRRANVKASKTWIKRQHAKEAFEEVACALEPEEAEAPRVEMLGRYCSR